MIRTVIVAGLIALPLVTAAPAVAEPSSTVSCSNPCKLVDVDVEQAIKTWAELPANIAENYAEVPQRMQAGWGSGVDGAIEGWGTLPQRIVDGWSNPGNADDGAA